MGISYLVQNLPLGLALDTTTGMISGTVEGPVGDYPSIFAGSTIEGQQPLSDIVWRVRPAGFVGIDDMAIGDSFIVEDNNPANPVDNIINQMNNFGEDFNGNT